MLIFGILLIALLSGLLIGYTTAVIAGALVLLDAIFDFTPWQEGLIVSAILIGGFLGALISSKVATPLGPKKSLFITAVIFILGTVCVAYSSSFWAFVASRFTTGLGVGFATMIGPLYVAETAPDKWRGLFVSSVQFAITIGIFLAYLAGYVFSPDKNWSMMFLLALIPAILLAVTSCLIVESPRWLMLQGKEKAAKKNYFALHKRKWSYEPKIIEKSSITLEHLFDRTHLPVLLFACSLFFFQNLSGIDAILYYAPRIFQTVGFTDGHSALFVTTLLGLINILATLASLWLIDQVGRRNLLIFGLAFMVLSLLLFSSLTHTEVLPWLSVSMLMIFIIAFAISIGPIPYVLMSELFPLKMRATGMAIASSTAWGINALITFAYPILIEQMGMSLLFLCFSAICFIALLISLFYCPETKLCSLETIEINLAQGKKLRELGDRL